MDNAAAKVVLYPETDELAPLVREKAIAECVDVWKKGQEIRDYPPLWGDEIEYTLLELDGSTRTAKLCLQGDEIYGQLKTSMEAGVYAQEPGAFQIESKPAQPFDSSAKSLLSVEKDMAARRATIKSRLGPNRYPFTISTFPLLGTQQDVDRGRITSPALVAQTTRYRAFQHHITARRHGASSPITTPLYPDRNTVTAASSSPFPLPTFITAADAPTNNNININPDDGGGGGGSVGGSITFAPDEILLGVAQCGLQCTLQCGDSRGARSLHDALVPLGPVALALSAATPAYRGYLADTDARWNTFGRLVDDRDGRERRAQGRWRRARYGVSEAYLTTAAAEDGDGGEDDGDDGGLVLEGSVQEDRETVRRLQREGGLEKGVARYYAAAFARPLFMYPRTYVDGLKNSSFSSNGGGGGGGYGEEGGRRRGEGKGQEDEEEHSGGEVLPPNANFEHMHGSFYPHVKFKHPTAAGEGWRVEFRPMEVQLSDFENAAYVVFVVLVARATQRFGVDWRVPLEKVWENFERAHPRDAVRWQRFWWRVGDGRSKNEEGPVVDGVVEREDAVALLTMDEIINGCQSFKGIMSLVVDYMNEEGFTSEEQEQLQPYLDLVSGRASGRLCTAARFLRDFVTQHPKYMKDSQVSEEVCFDLLQEVKGIADGKRDSRLFC